MLKLIALGLLAGTICDWGSKPKFETCVREQITRGAALSELEKLMDEHGFTRAPDTAPSLAYFYRWDTTGIYKVAVSARYDEEGKILDLEVN